MTRRVEPVTTPVDIVIRPPGSKSQTIRALFMAALADGESSIAHPLDAEDTRAARDCLRSLGVDIDDSREPWTVVGSGGVLLPSPAPLNAGASGLTARALIAVSALVDGVTTVVGEDRLPERPMSGLIGALTDLGVEVVAAEGEKLPVTVSGVGALRGGEVDVPSRATTQFLTGLLLAAPRAVAPLRVDPVGMEGSAGYVDMTIRMMQQFGADVSRDQNAIRVAPSGYRGTEIDIEPDASAAVYPMVAAAITGGKASIEGLGPGSLQPDLDIARLLGEMGCVVSSTSSGTTVDAQGVTLAPVDADLSGSPDGALAVAVACLFASGESRLRGLGSLRHKESDRLQAVATEIRRLGAGAVVDGDELVISPSSLTGARVETYDDHRIAMSFALVGLRVPGVEIENPTVVRKTWPGFWDMLHSLSG